LCGSRANIESLQHLTGCFNPENPVRITAKMMSRIVSHSLLATPLLGEMGHGKAQIKRPVFAAAVF
jgi:hypothetical protein